MRVISGKARGTKLYSIEGKTTRPTLDRVKESLFNILQNRIEDAIVLDLFAGSGALGIECLSRGSKQAYFCDNSKQAILKIKQNLSKTKLEKQAFVFEKDYCEFLTELCEKQLSFNIIFLDPPYAKNVIGNCIEYIIKGKLLKKDGIIVVETDEEQRDKKQIEQQEIEIRDIRKYGRVTLLFLS